MGRTCIDSGDHGTCYSRRRGSHDSRPPDQGRQRAVGAGHSPRVGLRGQGAASHTRRPGTQRLHGSSSGRLQHRPLDSHQAHSRGQVGLRRGGAGGSDHSNRDSSREWGAGSRVGVRPTSSSRLHRWLGARYRARRWEAAPVVYDHQTEQERLLRTSRPVDQGTDLQTRRDDRPAEVAGGPLQQRSYRRRGFVSAIRCRCSVHDNVLDGASPRKRWPGGVCVTRAVRLRAPRASTTRTYTARTARSGALARILPGATQVGQARLHC